MIPSEADGPKAIERIDDAARRLKAAAAASSERIAPPEGLEDARLEVRRARDEVEHIAGRLSTLLRPE